MEQRKYYGLYIQLPSNVASALAKLANQEYRDMKAQAVYLIAKNLKELNMLDDLGKNQDGETTQEDE